MERATIGAERAQPCFLTGHCMKNIKEEFKEFLDETREVASKLGISEEELFDFFLKLKYGKKKHL